MGTVVNTLYPPVVSTFSNAFIFKEDAKIYFTISQYNSPQNIARVHVTVVNQLNNENALTDVTGVLFQPLSFDEDKKMYYVTVPVANMAMGSFALNQYYKVQIRFDNKILSAADTAKYGNVIDNTMSSIQKQSYLLNETPYFSEWSSVCLIRGIEYPHLRIKVFDNYKDSSLQALNKGIIPIVGGLYFDANNDKNAMDKNETETMQSYEIKILDKKGELLLSSGKIYTGNNLDPNDINYRIDLQTLTLEDGEQLTCRVDVVTKNQYHFHEDYKFQIANYDNLEDFDPVITQEVDNENGIVTINVKTTRNIIGGICYIKRLSSEDNFATAQLIKSSYVHGPVDITVRDNTVSSLVWYKYTVQYESVGGVLAPIVESDVIMPDFYDAIISRDDQQYSIRYNYNVSSYKPVVNRTKIDTLGGKYPRFAENAVLNYKQFSISGLISAEADMYQLFLAKNKVFVNEHNNDMSTYYDAYKKHPHSSILSQKQVEDYKDPDEIRDLVRNDVANWKKFEDMAERWTDDNAAKAKITAQSYLTTTQNDWLWERKFREALVAWLNDGEPKLYRSKQEGSMVVMITDITLSPTPQHSRFTYGFSATVYEVEDANSLEVLNNLGIYKVKTVETLEEDGNSHDKPQDHTTVKKLGQLYNFTVTDKYPIEDNILNTLKMKYGYTGLDADKKDIYDKESVLASKKPDNLTIKNIKIYFQSPPNLYYYNGDNLVMADRNQYTGQYSESIYTLGYTFRVGTTASDGESLIFVNDKGYYQIPDSLDVTSLSFDHIGDVVTIEYTIIYDEYNNSTEVVSGSTVDRNVIGQIDGVFEPNVSQGDIIKQKYNYISQNNYRQYMDFWKGICLDVTPHAVCDIQYRNVDGTNTYEVGGTGVLHMLKNFEVKDLRFLGRKMTICDNSRQPFLEGWECCLDKSVKETVGYVSAADIPNPIINTVYKINGRMMIFYIDGNWYGFDFMKHDSTNIAANAPTTKIGLAKVPIEGQINYQGSVIKTSLA